MEFNTASTLKEHLPELRETKPTKTMLSNYKRRRYRRVQKATKWKKSSSDNVKRNGIRKTEQEIESCIEIESIDDKCLCKKMMEQ